MFGLRYKVGKYIRLSEQDGDKKESESVENQRDLIEHFIKIHEDLEDVEEYVDDGYTGANFDRPAFKRMLGDIKSGKIDCIITKDLSRFGRDHIDTGYYLERYLPSMGIRYIAIGDRIDTKDSTGLQFLSFKLSFNDYYIEDISRKIKSVKKRKMLNGEYQAGIPSYGYKKDPNQKNHLIIDKNVYKIVQQIFDMYANKGMSTIKIADELNRRNITPPGVYLNMPNTRGDSKNPDKKYVWLRTQIGSMLKNQVYIGNVVSGKTEQITPKIKEPLRKEESEYIVVKNMHEPIINEELWNKVQEKLKSYKNKVDNRKKYNYVLKDLVYCGECGNIATFQHCKSKDKNGRVYWEGNYAICRKRNDYKSLCDNTLLGEHILLEEIKNTIKQELDNIEYSFKELKAMYSKAKAQQMKKSKTIDDEINEKKSQLSELAIEFENIYKKKISKTISTEEFNNLYNKIKNQRDELNLMLEKLEENQTNKVKNKSELSELKKIVSEFLRMEKPDNETLKKLVERVEFDKQKNITIKLKFSNYYTT